MQSHRKISIHLISSGLLMSYLFWLCFITSPCFALSSANGDDWNTMKQNTFSSLTKTRYNYGKPAPSVSKHKSSSSSFSSSSGRKFRSDSGSDSVLPRQGGWGWGWPGSSYGGGGGSYDVYTIIAVAAFAALFGALIYELAMGSSMRRSLEKPPAFNYEFPSVSLGLDSEKFPEVMVKVGDWIANSAWFDNVGNNSNSIRDFGQKIGIRKWFEAFKKDPVEYQCIRKMACEMLAASPLAAKSLNTTFGGAFLSVFGNFIDNGDELRSLVKEVVGNPKKCEEMVLGGYCEEN
ncbi:unnamed protein product [Orchesella dallaii]|uniref:Uncharacterized protein n=1 Tax=Orchesella dallaii TaxID=48710 RepID=A0ABP1PUA8_9HEXA